MSKDEIIALQAELIEQLLSIIESGNVALEAVNKIMREWTLG